MAEFRLARVRRLHTQLRRLRQQEADALAATAATLAERLRVLVEERERRALDEAREAAAGRLTQATLQLGRDYDGVLAADEQRCRAEIDAVAAALDAKREELARERREERTLERLEETHRQRLLEQEARATSVLLDELALARHAHRAKEGR